MKRENPYIGPRPYRRGEGNFFGREREGKELAWLILAERAVLFYAQSGAGKTSLLNARVIPYLEKSGVQVLPVARVGSGLPEAITPDVFKAEDTAGGSANRNIFVFSALLALSADLKIPPAALLDHTLLSYLQEYTFRPLPADDTTASSTTQNPQSKIQNPTLLIFDQFEEIATTHREHWTQAEGFFRQVREAIDALPGLSVLFALREDYVAELDPYTPLLPSHLQARFRMTLPTHSQAMQIVMGPAEQAKCPFTEEAAQNLVTNLSRIKARGTEGGIGQYVEPVQLQVVCRQLWESLPDSVSEDGVITWDEIKHYNVDDALTTFYESTLVQTCQVSENLTGLTITERRLRRWFSEALITPEGRRGLALQGATETAGLPNAVVRVLENHYLIRSDTRGVSRWYELSHDRLVEPIVQSNREWEAARETPLRTAAKQWQASQNEGVLYRDKMLDEALAWAEANPDEVEDYEKEFLKAGEKAQQTRQKIKRLRKTMVAGLSISLVIMIALTVWALAQSRIAISRQLAAQAQQIYLTDNTSEGFHKSVLLATESMLRSPSAEAIWSIHNGLNFIPDAPLAQLEGLNTVVSPDGKWLAVASRHGLIVRDTTMWAALPQKEPYEDVLSLAFSSDSRWLATAAKDHIVRVRDTTNWNVIARLEHDNVVNTVTFGPNNQWLAAMSASGTLRVWQRKTGDWIEIVTQISGPRPQETTSVVPDRVTCDTLRTASLDETFEYTLRRSVVSSRDGKQLAAIGTDNIVRVWETNTWRQLMSLKHNSTILAIAFSADGTWLATAGGDNTAHVWNTSTWTESFSVYHQCSVHALAFSPDGQYLTTGSDDMTSKISTVPEGELVALLRHNGAIWAASFNSDGKLLATGSLDGTARLWEANTGREISRMVQGPVWGLNFAPGNDWLAASGQVEIQKPGEFNVNVWRLTTQTITPHIERQEAVVRTIFSPNGRWFAAASWDGSVSVWDTDGSLDPILLKYDEPVGERAIWSIAFSPDSHLLAAGCGDGHVRVWDIATGSLVAKLQQGEAWDKIMTVAWSSDGQWVASGSRRTARVWDVANEKEVSRMVNESPVRDLAFSPDGTKLATGSLDSGLGLDGDNVARIWDTVTGQELARFEHRGQVWSVAFSPDGTRLATASEDRTARLWDVATGEELIRWGHQAYVREVVFSPDGWWLAAASLDGTATIWSTKLLIHRPLVKLDHEDGVWTVAFSSDGQWLATGTRNGTARVWQVLTGKEVFRTQHSVLVGHLRGLDDLAYSRSLVTTVAFSPDGRWLATGGMNGAARIWNWKSADIIAEACERLPRNLTHEEWKKYLPGRLYRPTCPNTTLPIPQDTFVPIATARPMVTSSANSQLTSAATPMPTPTAPPALASPDPLPTTLLLSSWDDFGYGIAAHAISLPDYTLDQVAYQLGFTWVKQQVRWDHFSPAPGQMDWSGYDAVVNAADERGVKLIFSVVGAPAWSRSYFDANPEAAPPDDFTLYAQFLDEMVDRYKGRLHAIEVWNEQNLDREWDTAEGINAARYVEMLQLSYQAIKSRDPSIIVISGALSPTSATATDSANPNRVIYMDDFVYFQQMIDAGFLNYADCVGAHHNGINMPPDVAWDEGYNNPNAKFREPFDNPHPSWSFKSTLWGYHEMIQAAGFNKPLCVTKFGWATAEGFDDYPTGLEFVLDNTLTQQAEWNVGAFQLMREWGFVYLAFLWNLDYSYKGGLGPTDPDAPYSILDLQGAARPAYEALSVMPKSILTSTHTPIFTPTPVSSVTVGCRTDTPAAACARLRTAAQHFTWSEISERADIILSMAISPDALLVGQWIYALTAPFFTVHDGVQLADLRAAWGGTAENLSGHPLFISANTLAVFAANWGEPSGAVRIITATHLLSTAQALDGWALLPFESLTPEWKVLRVDGQTPLSRTLDLTTYPLTFDLYLSSATRPETLALLDYDAATFSNRHTDQMTVVVLTGVTTMSRGTARLMEREGVTYPARDILPWFADADFVHVSNEVAFTPTCTPDPGGSLVFCSHDSYIELLEAIGTNVVELTGNHLGDVGHQWIHHSLEMYAERGWGWYGGGADLADATRPLTLTHNGNRIAFLGCNPSGTAFFASETLPGAAPCSEVWQHDLMHRQVSALRAEGYLPIVTLQHREVDQYEPWAGHIRDMRTYAVSGAVIVHGSQAHWVKPMEFHAGAFIHYGPGNLFFDQMWAEGVRQGFLTRYTFHAGSLASIEMLPYIIEEYGRPRPMTNGDPASEADRTRFLEMMFALSEQLP